MKSKFFDISPAISPQTAVFPGDTPFSQTIHLDFKKGDNLKLSSFNTSAHIGAHADSPCHYNPNGKSIHQVDVARYMGHAQVIQVSSLGDRILLSEIQNTPILSKRILIKTNSFPDPNRWNSDFRSLSPELVQFLFQKGVVLIGIDTPSIDPANDQKLHSHNAVFNCGISVLEGIDLTEVPEGEYQLIALPLKLNHLDASPVRAVLLDLSYNLLES